MQVTIYKMPHYVGSIKFEDYAIPLTDCLDILATDSMLTGYRNYQPRGTEVEVIGVMQNSASVDKLLIIKDGKYQLINTDYFMGNYDDRQHLNFTHLYPRIPGAGARLINSLRGSDSGETEISIQTLASVVSFTEMKESEKFLTCHSPYSLPSLTRLEMVLENGSNLLGWYTSVGYFEGYQYDIFASKKSAYRDFTQSTLLSKSDGLECWECGATYDEPGHVDEGNMECDRCR
jgi:hypothetical protein